MSVNPPDIDTEQVDEGAERIEGATEDVSGNLRRYAKVYLSVLFLGIAGLIVGAYVVGVLDPQIVIRAEVSVGWILEYLVLGIVAVFLLFTASMALVILPGSFTAGIISGIARIADAYELPQSRPDGTADQRGDTAGDSGGEK